MHLCCILGLAGVCLVRPACPARHRHGFRMKDIISPLNVFEFAMYLFYY